MSLPKQFQTVMDQLPINKSKQIIQCEYSQIK